MRAGGGGGMVPRPELRGGGGLVPRGGGIEVPDDARGSVGPCPKASGSSASVRLSGGASLRFGGGGGG
ncbi:MAG: hypothetical protein FJ096_10040 [Deltaproteobacteria bacterium]|nr:hypothetical protein [Deltaproteobacteria bacterium]